MSISRQPRPGDERINLRYAVGDGMLLDCMLTDRPTVCFAGPAKGVSALPHAFIVPDHDCDAVGTEMITFLKDRALAAELGANTGATVLVNFEWRQICAKIECIYDRLLAVPTEVASTQNHPRCLVRAR